MLLVNRMERLVGALEKSFNSGQTPVLRVLRYWMTQSGFLRWYERSAGSRLQINNLPSRFSKRAPVAAFVLPATGVHEVGDKLGVPSM